VEFAFSARRAEKARIGSFPCLQNDILLTIIQIQTFQGDERVAVKLRKDGEGHKIPGG
jgi:hypothetical protein